MLHFIHKVNTVSETSHLSVDCLVLLLTLLLRKRNTLFCIVFPNRSRPTRCDGDERDSIGPERHRRTSE